MNSLQRYVGLLLKHRHFIFWLVLIVTVVTMLFSLIAAPIFTSTAQILPPTGDETSVMSLPSILGSTGLSNIARLSSSLRGSSQSSDLISAILLSRTIRERVIDSCDFMNVYKFQKDQEEALRALSEMTKVHVTDEGIVTIAVEGKTAAYAAQLANSYVTELDRFLRESNMSRGRNTRIFVGKRLEEAKQELNTAKESLVTFQKANRVTAVDEETKAAVEAYAKLRADKMKADMDLQFATDLAGDANPYVENLRQHNVEFERQLTDFEQGHAGTPGFGVGSGVPLSGVPAVAAEYMRRLGDFELQQELLALLEQQYEQAKITEVRDTPAITVLDPPRVPQRRSFPKRGVMTITAFVISLFTGIMLSLVMEFWEGQKGNPKTWQEWQRIATVLKDEARRLIRPRRRPKE